MDLLRPLSRTAAENEHQGLSEYGFLAVFGPENVYIPE